MEKFPQKKEILFASHLNDIDDLKKYRRDAPIEDSDKNREDLNILVSVIINKIKESKKTAILLVTSSRLRAKETAELVSSKIKEIIGENNIKIRFNIEDRLRAPDQGSFILPEDYIAGSYFEGLKIASDVFYNESLNKEDRNMYYKYGDPVLKENGTYKYPELLSYFHEYGETYANSVIRLFSLIIETSKKIEKLNLSTEIVIISHSFVYEIFRGLSILSQKIKDEGFILKTGEIPYALSEIFESRITKLKDTAYSPLDVTNLGDKNLIKILQDEIAFLKNK